MDTHTFCSCGQVFDEGEDHHNVTSDTYELHATCVDCGDFRVKLMNRYSERVISTKVSNYSHIDFSKIDLSALEVAQ